MASRLVPAAATFSVLGADVVIRGSLEAGADLHIDGTVEGDIACASLVQGESSRVEGAIRAENARLSGEVKGPVAVRDLVVLRSARLEGDVYYDTLTIEHGAHVNGRFVPDTAKAPAQLTAASAEEDEEEPRLTLAG